MAEALRGYALRGLVQNPVQSLPVLAFNSTDNIQEISVVIDMPPVTIPTVQQVATAPASGARPSSIDVLCDPMYSDSWMAENEFAPSKFVDIYKTAMYRGLGYYWDSKRSGYYNQQGQKYPAAQVKTQILVKPKLGVLDSEGEMYTPYLGATGKDKAVLLVTSLGKQFRVTITLNIKYEEEPNNAVFDPCRIIKAPAPGAAASWFNPDHSNLTVTFSDIPGQSE